MKLNVVSFDKGDSMDKNDSFDKGREGSLDKGDESTDKGGESTGKATDKGDNSDTSSADQAEKTTDQDTSGEKRPSVDRGDAQATTTEASSSSPQNGADNASKPEVYVQYNYYLYIQEIWTYMYTISLSSISLGLYSFWVVHVPYFLK